jgi:hypothetical protein
MARQVIDWRAIPRRYRAWKALPAWRKVLWTVSRTAMSVVLYVAFAAGILWFNEPRVVEGIAGGDESPLALVGLFATQPELLALVLLLVPAVLAAVLLPHRTDWS